MAAGIRAGIERSCYIAHRSRKSCNIWNSSDKQEGDSTKLQNSSIIQNSLIQIALFFCFLLTKSHRMRSEKTPGKSKKWDCTWTAVITPNFVRLYGLQILPHLGVLSLLFKENNRRKKKKKWIKVYKEKAVASHATHLRDGTSGNFYITSLATSFRVSYRDWTHKALGFGSLLGILQINWNSL